MKNAGTTNVPKLLLSYLKGLKKNRQVNVAKEPYYLMAKEEYDSLMETLYIMSDKDTYKAIMEPDMEGAKIYASAEEALRDCGFYDQK